MVFKTVGWIIILHGQEMSQTTLVRNVPKYMRIFTKLESGMTRNALCLPQTRMKPQLSSVKKGSCDGEASICIGPHLVKGPRKTHHSDIL